MRSVHHLQNYPAGHPLVADDIVEFHAARLLLVLFLCGKRNKIRGLTKLAKLDFFVRYPSFFQRAAEDLGHPTAGVSGEVEAAMVRHYYGPWDRRYYHVLAALEGKGLIRVKRVGARTYEFELTLQGIELAGALVEDDSYAALADIMRRVGTVFRNVSGNALKQYIYRTFDQEIAKRRLGDVIAP